MHIHIAFILALASYLIIEHENNQEIQLKFDFERMPSTNDNDSEEYMNEETLPLKMRKLIDKQNKIYYPTKKKPK